MEFTGQRIKWICDPTTGKKSYIRVEQSKSIETLSEITIPKGLGDKDPCSASLHAELRSLLGSINWLQSRSQFQACYLFSRLASASAAPTIGDCKALNKLCRDIRNTPAELRFWPLRGTPRIVLYPDAAYKNNSDSSSQRAQVIFLAEERSKTHKDSFGSLVFFESTKM